MTGPLSILIVGTDSPEQKTLGQAFRKYGVPHRYLAADEDSAVRAYFQKGLADALFVPTLIMLDRDTSQPETVLNLLKQHPILRRIPVILYGRDNNPESVKTGVPMGGNVLHAPTRQLGFGHGAFLFLLEETRCPAGHYRRRHFINKLY